MHKEKPLIELDEKKIATVVTLPENNSKDYVVILVHGGPGGVKEGPEGIFNRLSNALVQEGIATIQFDFLGAGESDGDYIDMTMANQVKEYRRVLRYAKDSGFGRLGLAGESFGATCALGAFSEDISVLALLWPAIYLLDNTFAPYVKEEHLQELEKNGYIDEDGVRVGRSFIEELFKVDNLEDNVRKVNVPTILIHGDSDTEVPYHQSEKAYAILKEPKKLVIVPGGDHCLAKRNEQTIVIYETVNWFKQYLKE